MKNILINSWLYLLKILSLSLFLQPNMVVLSQTNEINPDIKNISIPLDIQFTPPPGGEPPDTSGAGSRNPNQLRCSPSQQQIKPLMPKGNYGLTLQEHPAIYIELPQTSAKQVVLAFQDETEEYHETVFLPIQNTNSHTFVSFKLPPDKPPLTPGKHYKWKLSFVCGEIPDVEDPTLEGWVKRVQPNSRSNQLGKDAIKQAQWYARNGYWYDLLAVLDKEIQANPENTRLTSLWHNLLQRSNVDSKESYRDKVDKNERG